MENKCATPSPQAHNVSSMSGGKVVVLGGGFGGIGAARTLKDADVDVVLVDKHDYHTFQPLLYKLATGLLETSAVGHSLRDKGTMATIGRGAAVVQKGWKAQVACGTMHLVVPPTNEDRAKAVVDWTWEEFTQERPGRITVETKAVV